MYMIKENLEKSKFFVKKLQKCRQFSLESCLQGNSIQIPIYRAV